MSEADEPTIPELTRQQWWLLEQMAISFDELSTGSPPPPDEHYTAVQFVEWLLLMSKAKGYQHRGERDRRGPGHNPGRALAVAG